MRQPALFYVLSGKNNNATPADIGLKFESIRFKTKDQITLAGWWIPSGNERGVVLFSHGNTGNMADCLESLKFSTDSDSAFLFMTTADMEKVKEIRRRPGRISTRKLAGIT